MEDTENEQAKSGDSSSSSDSSDQSDSSSQVGNILEKEEEEMSLKAPKSKNEITDQEALDKLAPKLDQSHLDELETYSPFGQVLQYVTEQSGLLLVLPSDPSDLLDLDNIVCFPTYPDKELSKLIVGYVSDVVGPVSMPFYTVTIYKEVAQKFADHGADFWKGRDVCLVDKCMKSIKSKLPDMMKQKGCDASNLYDEELSTVEQASKADMYFSDDEKEQAFERRKKAKRGPREDGEMAERQYGKGSQKKRRFDRGYNQQQ